jgi:PAS domain S-box-containing protein
LESSHGAHNYGVGFSLSDVMISVLLFIGMIHTESVMAGRLRLENKEKKLLSRVEALTRENEELVGSNQQLVKQLSARERNQDNVSRSEKQLRSLFMQHPSPMWIFDLRSFAVIDANQAALRQYGYALEDFLATPAQSLLDPAEVSTFLQDAAKPGSSVSPQQLCRHRKKNGTSIEVEASLLDLMYEDRPARLVLAPELAGRRRLDEQTGQETTTEFAAAAARHFATFTTVIEAYSKNLLLQKIQPSSAADQIQRIATAASQASEFARLLEAAAARHAASNQPLDWEQIFSTI